MYAGGGVPEAARIRGGRESSGVSFARFDNRRNTQQIATPLIRTNNIVYLVPRLRATYAEDIFRIGAT